MTREITSPAPLWSPDKSRIERSNLYSFQQFLSDHYKLTTTSYKELHRWSVDKKELFWPAVSQFCNLPFEPQLSANGIPDGPMFPRGSWFPESKFNFAQALLPLYDNTPAIISFLEDGLREEISFSELHVAVVATAQFLLCSGVESGDRVAGYLPNIIPTIVAMLATSSIGALWSSCSPDFGVQGVVDRFSQIEPKVLFTVSSYQYNGKIHDNSVRLSEIISKLPSLKKIVLCDKTPSSKSFGSLKADSYFDLLNKKLTSNFSFEKFPFDHPLYILYSSGTTGAPKCIVHGAGGTLLQHAKELSLHTDLKAGEKILYFTTCGWMMWNWLVSALALKATVVLYDGAPLYPTPQRLFEIVDSEKISILGVSAKYLSAVENSGLKPRKLFSLKSLSTILSTGSPLLPVQYDFAYRDIKNNLCLSSISGGTDIVSCFALGNPTQPVFAGKLQSIGLGMDLDIFDENGKSQTDLAGELVCKSPFPSMPIYFWNDPDNQKYKDSYFDTFPGVWRHGDWASLDSEDRLTIYGRSDATLNPGGVRIGTAEIYRVVEQFAEIAEAIAVEQPWKGDVRIVLFLKLLPENALSEKLIQTIKQKIKVDCSPRHVPAKIIAIPDIPRTISGKIVELAVRNMIDGRPIKNKEALANPQALDYFVNIQELLED